MTDMTADDRAAALSRISEKSVTLHALAQAARVLLDSVEEASPAANGLNGVLEQLENNAEYLSNAISNCAQHARSEANRVAG